MVPGPASVAVPVATLFRRPASSRPRTAQASLQRTLTASPVPSSASRASRVALSARTGAVRSATVPGGGGTRLRAVARGAESVAVRVGLVVVVGERAVVDRVELARRRRRPDRRRRRCGRSRSPPGRRSPRPGSCRAGRGGRRRRCRRSRPRRTAIRVAGVLVGVRDQRAVVVPAIEIRDAVRHPVGVGVRIAAVAEDVAVRSCCSDRRCGSPGSCRTRRGCRRRPRRPAPGGRRRPAVPARAGQDLRKPPRARQRRAPPAASSSSSVHGRPATGWAATWRPTPVPVCVSRARSAAPAGSRASRRA